MIVEEVVTRQVMIRFDSLAMAYAMDELKQLRFIISRSAATTMLKL